MRGNSDLPPPDGTLFGAATTEESLERGAKKDPTPLLFSASDLNPKAVVSKIVTKRVEARWSQNNLSPAQK